MAIPHIMALADDPRHAIWDTLEGRSVADLEQLVERRRKFPLAPFPVETAESGSNSVD